MNLWTVAADAATSYLDDATMHRNSQIEKSSKLLQVLRPSLRQQNQQSCQKSHLKWKVEPMKISQFPTTIQPNCPTKNNSTGSQADDLQTLWTRGFPRWMMSMRRRCRQRRWRRFHLRSLIQMSFAQDWSGRCCEGCLVKKNAVSLFHFHFLVDFWCARSVKWHRRPTAPGDKISHLSTISPWRWKSLLHYLVGGLGIIIIITIIIIILLLLYGNISQLPLVSWNMTLGFLNMFFPYIGNNQPNWLSYFSEG